LQETFLKTTAITSSNLITVTLVFTLLAFLALTGFRNGRLPWSNTRDAGSLAHASVPAAVEPEHLHQAEEIPLPISGLADRANETALSVPTAAPTGTPTLTPTAEQSATPAPTPKIKYRAGEDPEFARQSGWPVKGPKPLAGAILPHKRILAFYGNPLSWRMGILGKSSKEDMLQRLNEEVAQWEAADPSLKVQPALHLIAVTAQSTSGKAGKYRMIMPDKIVNQVYGWAKEANALLFIDLQTGHEDIRDLLPRFEWILKNPDVHLGIDPEFNLVKTRAVPGTQIGTFDAEEVNYVTSYLRELVQKYNLPPKVLTVHRFTQRGVTNFREIELNPEIQIVMHMDGWGSPWLKRDSYKSYIVNEPVQYAGFKIFFHNDTKKGDDLMTPADMLKLSPKPLYIQYQ
jgi:hypothetical protein